MEAVEVRLMDKLRGAPAPEPAPEPTVDEPTTPVACEDDAAWYYSGKQTKNCAYVAAGEAKGDHRCKASNTDGTRSALEACPRTCGRCSI
jgi:hypothetical protein